MSKKLTKSFGPLNNVSMFWGHFCFDSVTNLTARKHLEYASNNLVAYLTVLLTKSSKSSQYQGPYRDSVSTHPPATAATNPRPNQGLSGISLVSLWYLSGISLVSLWYLKPTSGLN